MNDPMTNSCMNNGGLTRTDGKCFSCGTDGSECTDGIQCSIKGTEKPTIVSASVAGAVRWIKRGGFLNKAQNLVLQQAWTYNVLNQDFQVIRTVTEWKDVPIEENP